MQPEQANMFEGLHHVQLATPRGEESAAPAFFVDDLGEVRGATGMVDRER